MEVYLTRSVGSRRFRLLVWTDMDRSGFGGRVQIFERSDCYTTLRTLSGLQRLCVKFEAAESILAYGFVGCRIEEIDKHKFFRVSREII